MCFKFRGFGFSMVCSSLVHHSWYLNFNVKDCKFWFVVGYVVDGIINANIEKRNELSVGNLDS